MPVQTDPTTLRLGDSIVIETSFENVPLALHGKLSNLLPKVVWVNVAEPGCPPLVNELKEGHPVRLVAARQGSALVGESTFRSCLGSMRRLVAVERPIALRLVDRRSQLRVALRRSVGIRLARNSAAGEGGHFAIGTSFDISVTGMRFDTTVHMAVGDHVFVTVVLERNEPLYALAQIVRLDDSLVDRAVASKYGPQPWSEGRRLVRATVQWQAMVPADRKRLQDFLISLDEAAAG
jgi:c-di-GMP-binding flagellar brake protein YcgR